MILYDVCVCVNVVEWSGLRFEIIWTVSGCVIQRLLSTSTKQNNFMWKRECVYVCV